MTEGPLAGIRVIDLTSVVVGPICTRTLADYGADVIKIEPRSGDLLRTMAQGSRTSGMSGKFLNFNRNKRSIALDLKQPQAREAVCRLIETADVFVNNIRPKALLRAGLDYKSLAPRNPRLIHCSILAFGSGGRYYDQPAYDPIIQSLSGVAGTFERATGEPTFVPMVMTDHITGITAAQAVGFALFRRERTGRGEAVEVPMMENMASFVTSEHMGPATFEPPIGEPGDNRLLTPHYRPQKTKDGYITISPNTNAQAFGFFEAIGRPELQSDPRFDSAGSRTENADAFFEVRAAGLLQKTTAEWLRVFAERDIPAARYNSLDDLFDDPHLADVGFFATEEHPTEGTIRRTSLPNSFSGGASEAGSSDCLPAPRLGQHTRALLAEIGYEAQQIDDMISNASAFESA